MEDELATEFGKSNFSFEDAKAMQQCLSLCSSFGLRLSELADSWDVFSINSNLSNIVQNAQIENFRRFLQTQQRDAFCREHGNMHTYAKDDVEFLHDEMDVESTPPQIAFQTPNKPSAPTKNSDSAFKSQLHSPATPFSQRTTKCTVQFAFNEHLSEGTPSAGPEINMEEPSDGLVLHRQKEIRRCRLEILSFGPKSGCRYMADQLEARFNELERRIKRFAQAFSDHEGRLPLQHVSCTFQEKAVVVGRICCDGEGHLNDKSVLLEGSVEYSGGQRVRLDLRDLSHFSLFPGQIVAVEGQNPSGHCIVASQIYDSIPLPPFELFAGNFQAAKRQTTDEGLRLCNDDPLCIIAAAGPFTTSDNLSFEPFMELLSYCRKTCPNLLLLMGPFVDSEHPLIKQGTAQKLLGHVFQEEIRMRIEELSTELGEGFRVVLVPSTRDAFHDRVFPQPSFDSCTFEDPSRQITMLSNPGVFCIDDQVAIGCCTTDILKHLSSEESSRNPVDDRMTRLASHVIRQRSFYPLFPPAPGTRLDLTLDAGALDLPCSPDILFLPSDLVPFVKPFNYVPGAKQEPSDHLQSCTCIAVNTGRLAKGSMGGSLVEIKVLPRSQQQKSTQGNLVHGVPARTKLTVIRI